MTKERLSTLLRWAGIVLAGGVLVVVLSARGPGGPQRNAGISLLAPSGGGQSSLVPQSSMLAQTIAAVGAPTISGPYTSTTAAFSFDGDVRQLRPVPQSQPLDLPELEPGESKPNNLPAANDPVVQSTGSTSPAGPNMPSPIQNFAGLNFSGSCTGGSCGAGHPPDTNGDVGPNNYVENVNTSIGVFSKTGTQQAAFTFNSLFATAGTGTACDANNRGDPVALYDAQADRFIVTDFAFTNTTTGPFYECIAASKTGDPTGAWWLYALRADDDAHKFLADYPKLGVWPDGIYMSANMFDCSITCNGNYKGVRVWALNRAHLESGAALQAVLFDVSPSTIFTLLPSNTRGTPAPPSGTPNYFVSNDQSAFGLDIFKFHADFVTPASSTFTGPTLVTTASFGAPPSTIPEVSGNPLDSLFARLMVQNQYRDIAGAESLWVAHTADDAPSGVRWYQLNVTGGTIVTTPVQQSTYKPDASYRWMPSLAVDKNGDMAIGYSVSSASTHPDIRYAGRLAGDPANTLPQSEATLISGGGGQSGLCGGFTCIRWGDYSAMTVDPVDDCTFWYTNEYYAADGGDWQTRIGSFKFPSCGAVVTQRFVYLPNVQNNPAAPPSWTNILQESFEGTWPGAGWVVNDNGTGTGQYWGKSGCRANGDSFSAWAIGGGPFAPGSCGASYLDNGQSWAVYGPFSLAGATAAQFNLQMWLNTPTHANGSGRHDVACYDASIDDQTFWGQCWYGSTGNVFTPESLDLSNVPGLGNTLGHPNVWIAMIFLTNSDGITAAEGAYFDDLLVRKCLVASCPGLTGAPASSATTDGQLHSYAASLTRAAAAQP